MSVDGLSIMDGKSAKANGRGYVLELGEQSFDIPGWRLNDEEVAAFVFAAVPDAYASQMGKPTNMGVIGATFFYERARAICIVAGIWIFRTSACCALCPRRKCIIWSIFPAWPGTICSECGYRLWGSTISSCLDRPF
jgi:hypothetical protein